MLEQFLTVGVFTFLLVFARIGSVLMLIPGIGDTNVTPRIRLTLALAVSAVIAPLVAGLLPPLPASPLTLLLLMGREIAIGLMVGVAIRLLLSALHVAGSIIAFQSSLSVAQFFDPAQGQQGAIIGSFLGLLGLVLIFVTGLHLMLLRAAVDSYTLMPPKADLPLADFARLGVDFVSKSFLLGVQMASPFIVYGLVYNIAQGLVQRLMPQIQLFFILMPLQIMMALFVFMVTVGASMVWFLDQFENSMALFLAG